MQKVYLLTDWDGWGCGQRLWSAGRTHLAAGQGGIYGPGWILCYHNPLAAELLRHLNDPAPHPVLWECDGQPCISKHGLMIGCRFATARTQVPLPTVSAQERIRLAVLLSRQVYRDRVYIDYTERWLREGGVEEQVPSSGLSVVRSAAAEKEPATAAQASAALTLTAMKCSADEEQGIPLLVAMAMLDALAAGAQLPPEPVPQCCN